MPYFNCELFAHYLADLNQIKIIASGEKKLNFQAHCEFRGICMYLFYSCEDMIVTKQNLMGSNKGYDLCFYIF